MFTYFPPVCPITTANNATAPAAQAMVSLPGCVQHQPQTFVSLPGCVQHQPQTFVSLPGCVHTAQTMCCDTAAPAAPQAQTVFPPLTLMCGPGPAIPPAGAQAQTAFPLTLICGPGPVIPPAGAQAQFPTLSVECLKTATHVATAVLGCNAQAQAVAPAQAQTMLSAYPCPTVAQCAPTWNCGGAPAEAQFPTLSLECARTATIAATAVLGCNAQAQAVAPAAQAMASAYPCPTVAQCAPTWNCGGAAPAQAQFPTLSLDCVTKVATVATTALPTGPAITATIAATTAVANGAQAQAVAPAQGMVSAYPCPTVAQCAPTWNCGGNEAQAQFPTLNVSCLTATTTVLPTGPVITATVAATTAVANGAQAVAPAHHLLSAQPCPTVDQCVPTWNCGPVHMLSAQPCPTVDQCAPTWNCGTAPAQAQFPTLSLGCATIVTTTL